MILMLVPVPSVSLVMIWALTLRVARLTRIIGKHKKNVTFNTLNNRICLIQKPSKNQSTKGKCYE